MLWRCTGLSFQFASAVPCSLHQPGFRFFDVLLLSHKLETCFLLTSNENSWPRLSNSGPEKHADAHYTQMYPFAVRSVQAQQLYQPLVECLMCGLPLSLLSSSETQRADGAAAAKVSWLSARNCTWFLFAHTSSCNTRNAHMGIIVPMFGDRVSSQKSYTSSK